MSSAVKRGFIKTLKISGIIVGSLLLLMFLLPFVFPQTFTKKVNLWANQRINGHVSFSGTGLSFFKHFPALTLTLYDVNLQGSAPFQHDTLVAAKEISLGIDISSIFKSKININKIYLSQALINIQVDSAGRANYNIYKSGASQANAPADSSGASLGIEQILVEKSRLVYNDESLPMKIIARGFNYSGSGDLSKDVFDLHTHTNIQSFDFYYAKQAYILSKKVNADLVTKINTKSLAFIFQKNDLMINELPVQFTGNFAFLQDGYDMNFKVDSHESDLSNMFTALPSSYQKMLEHTDVNGTGHIQLTLAGKYIVKDNIKPNLSINLSVRDGYINSQKSPSPVKNLFINMDAKVPGLNPDSLYLNIDSVYFNIDKDYFSSVIKIKGVKQPDIYAKINTEIDLEKWNKAFGIKTVDLKGRYALHLLAQGKYITAPVRTGLRKVDTLPVSIPSFSLRSSFTNGYLKDASLPRAIDHIAFDVTADCPDHNYKHIKLALANLNIKALDNYIKGNFNYSNTDDAPVDAALEARFNLADLKEIYPLDSISLQGNLSASLHTKGSYLPAKKRFPVTVANVSLKNGAIQTRYYPHPIQNIQVSTTINNSTGTLAGTGISVKPISFSFENEPFFVKAELRNFDNVAYDIAAKGTLNIGKIYQVFALKGYDVKGTIAANFNLKGKQSDAVAGRYDKLFNSGTLKVNSVALSTDLFPKPFIISKGLFSFNQDKMRFDAFTAKYGTSQLVLDGAISNVIDYALKPGAVLKGDFNLQSDHMVMDDFMAFSGTDMPGVSAGKTSGVIMVPQNLDVSINASVKKLTYNGLLINDAKSQMTIKQGSVALKQTGFNMIGSPVSMDADYTNKGPQKAFFNYHINAKDFDIKKAYNQIKLFHDMATSAAHAQGLVSLDYRLSGRLNNNMEPVYASLNGGGVLSASKIKMHGFKLAGAIGSSTNHDSLSNNTDLTRVEIKTTIAKNIITIAPTKMRMAGFRIRFEGQASFDKAINIKFRLGLPPLGILGIPMTITGTQDKPKIRLGKGKKEDELQGAADDGD
jgi:AsmA protein